MLRHLRLKNLALVDELNWELGTGLNVLTGETGAGKSILIDGLNLLLGQRADRNLIRSGESSCVVEAVFELRSTSLLKSINSLLEECGAETCEAAALILKRSIAAEGSNRQFINGSPVTLQILKNIGNELVDIHGPHDHQSLLHSNKQLSILDAYGKLKSDIISYQTAFHVFRSLEQRIADLQTGQQQREQRIEMLRYQIQEIEQASPQVGEDKDVEASYRVATNAVEIKEVASRISLLLSENDDSVLTQLANVEKDLHFWQGFDSGISELVELNRSAIANLQELQHEATATADNIEVDSGTLAELEDRLSILNQLKRKYGPTFEAVFDHLNKSRQELEDLEGDGSNVEELRQRAKKAQEEMEKLAEKLHSKRTKAARPLSKQITSQLKDESLYHARYTYGKEQITPC